VHGYFVQTRSHRWFLECWIVHIGRVLLTFRLHQQFEAVHLKFRIYLQTAARMMRGSPLSLLDKEALRLDVGIGGGSQLTFANEGCFYEKYVRTRHHVS